MFDARKPEPEYTADNPPRAYISTWTRPAPYEGTAWQVISRASPVCAETDEPNARAVYAQLVAREPHLKLPETAPVWDGDAGEFRC